MALLLAPPVGSLANPVGPQAPPWMLELRQAGEDDPKGTLAEVQRRLGGTTETETRFWLLLIQGRMHDQLEEPSARSQALGQARSVLEALPGAGPHMGLWLQLEQLSDVMDAGPPQSLVTRLAQLRGQVNRIADPTLSCALHAWEVWALLEMRSHDEAWAAAEQEERCGRTTGVPYLEAMALSNMGLIKTMTGTGPTVQAEVLRLFDRALQLLGDGRMRWRQADVEWNLAGALWRLGDRDAALVHLGRVKALSLAIRNPGGVALANTGMARMMGEMGSWEAALPLLDEAQAAFGLDDRGVRTANLMGLRVQALASLGRPDVLAVIERARDWDKDSLLPVQRALLARAFAEGLASQGRYHGAYTELLRSNAFEQAGRKLANDSQALRLQARYDLARRDAENAELRHRSEAAQLALQAQVAERQALWAAVAALALLACGVGVVAWRGVARRQALADLALKDELTGCPNRRATTAYALAQLALARRLGLPFTVAMVDLDHFKRVNDTHGHAAGDALLKAFAQTAGGMLRGQDLLGRWGGEEWLLVMPGTRLDELPKVFERMQQAYAATQVPGLPVPHACTFSMGAASADEHVPSLEKLIALADERLYAAKTGGRNAVCVG